MRAARAQEASRCRLIGWPASLSQEDSPRAARTGPTDVQSPGRDRHRIPLSRRGAPTRRRGSAFLRRSRGTIWAHLARSRRNVRCSTFGLRTSCLPLRRRTGCSAIAATIAAIGPTTSATTSAASATSAEIAGSAPAAFALGWPQGGAPVALAPACFLAVTAVLVPPPRGADAKRLASSRLALHSSLLADVSGNVLAIAGGEQPGLWPRNHLVMSSNLPTSGRGIQDRLDGLQASEADHDDLERLALDGPVSKLPFALLLSPTMPTPQCMPTMPPAYA